ncbi:multidrug efflux SMR transporter [Pseudoclavibacter alba]|uniref:Multidrug efflux SMR transporter n=1 Tax=Pseudoclavibacter albus TaxID=272241 RepID=A0ABT2HXW0_9MICO|nr:multidrug efflux SMR transporter [Pseudoclavibacter alba]MCT2043162.1 multidrug efflux SMR transporter [Pseudoclavibacter alba]
MPWLVLLASAVLEAVWATALGASAGLTVPLPSIVFVIALIASSLGLAWAVKHIPIGTAYAVWTGVGAALTVSYAMVNGNEAVTPLRVLFIALIVLSVVGLKLVPTPSASASHHTSSGEHT